MARKLRIQYPGARYHVINRGNYRDDVFAHPGAREAFLTCLAEACTKAGWRLHAYILMRNHYHLLLETPEGNLVDGMRWLQSTFANRFNRFRGERGHVFQGRYTALLIEPEGLGAVAHYIHLNPVRAGILPVAQLAEFPESSYAALLNPARRPAALVVQEFLTAAGDLADTPAGRGKYGEYLTWLAENEPAQKQLKFAAMCSGWALGTEAFKSAVVAQHLGKGPAAGQRESSTREARQLAHTARLEAAMTRLGKTSADIESDVKSADWKTAIAAWLKATTTVTNPWLGSFLNMGHADAVSRYVSELRAGKRPQATILLNSISDIRV